MRRLVSLFLLAGLLAGCAVFQGAKAPSPESLLKWGHAQWAAAYEDYERYYPLVSPEAQAVLASQVAPRINRMQDMLTTYARAVETWRTFGGEAPAFDRSEFLRLADLASMVLTEYAKTMEVD